MIINNEPLSMPEVVEYIKKDKDSEKDLVGFMKKFTKLKLKDAQGLRKKIGELGLMKVKSEHIVKIIDTLFKVVF